MRHALIAKASSSRSLSISLRQAAGQLGCALGNPLRQASERQLLHGMVRLLRGEHARPEPCL